MTPNKDYNFFFCLYLHPTCHPDTQYGWKKREEITDYNIRLECGGAEHAAVQDCVRSKTFNMEEVIQDAKIGAGGTEQSLMNSSLWTEDMTSSWNGRDFTLTIPRPLTQGLFIDMVFLHFDYSLLRDIYIHDKDFFILNFDPFGLPSVYKRINPNESASYFYRFSLTEVEELNLDLDPCEEDRGYSFLTCVKESISNEIGCRSPWDTWSSQGRRICSTSQQFG